MCYWQIKICSHYLLNPLKFYGLAMFIVWHGISHFKCAIIAFASSKQTKVKEKSGRKKKGVGLVRESNSGPLAPEARIIPLDQQANCLQRALKIEFNFIVIMTVYSGVVEEDKKKGTEKYIPQPSFLQMNNSLLKCKHHHQQITFPLFNS